MYVVVWAAVLCGASQATPRRLPQNVASLLEEITSLQVALDKSESAAVQTAERLFTTQSDLSACIKAMNEARAGVLEACTSLPRGSDVVAQLSGIASRLEPQMPVPMLTSPRRGAGGAGAGGGPRRSTGARDQAGDVSAVELARRSVQDGSFWSQAKSGANASTGEDADVAELRKRAEAAEARVAELGTRLDTVVAAYAEARSELERDEEIFRSKLETIGDLHSRLAEAVDQNGLLKEAVVEADMKVRQLTQEVTAARAAAAAATASAAASGGIAAQASPRHRRRVSLGRVGSDISDGSGAGSDDDSMVLYKAAGDLSVMTTGGAPIALDEGDEDGNDGAGDGGVTREELEELQSQLARVEEAKRVLEEGMAKVEQDKVCNA